MINYQPIQFQGYVQPDPTSTFKYGHITQQVEYHPAISEATKHAFGYRGQERSLMFLLSGNNNTFHLLLEQNPQARIIRTIDNEPILTTQEQLMIDGGLELLSHYAERQLLLDASGKPVIDEFGLPIYAKDRLFFKGDLMDLDMRIPPCAADIEDGEFLQHTSVTEFFDHHGEE
jgi:hypothetical protein